MLDVCRDCRGQKQDASLDKRSERLRRPAPGPELRVERIRRPLHGRMQRGSTVGA